MGYWNIAGIVALLLFLFNSIISSQAERGLEYDKATLYEIRAAFCFAVAMLLFSR